jgi:uncharacterized protein
MNAALIHRPRTGVTMTTRTVAMFSLLAAIGFGGIAGCASTEAVKAPAPQAQSPQAQAPQAQPRKKYQFVLQVSDDNPRIWRQALQNAEALQRNMGRENVDVEIVANGYGLDMLKTESNVADLINGALDRSVDIVACGETMERTGVKKSDLVGGVRVVRGGLPEIANKVRAGWTYIKP